MRGWPVRGIGPGAKPLAAYDANTLNDRTGDIKLEMNGEYRYTIAQNIFNVFNLKGAIFIDAGNVWNFRNSNPNGTPDSLQFSFKNVYKQLGVDIGTGFRFDFSTVVLRIDLGFRVKRPDLIKNDGWKAPSIGFDDLFKKLFSREFREWRYENFNFSLGIGLPFQ
jgi:outer membrane protein assembly factor BamA